MERVFPNYQCVDNYRFAQLGRIWVLFDTSIRLRVLDGSRQAMHCHVYSEALGKYFFDSYLCI